MNSLVLECPLSFDHLRNVVRQISCGYVLKPARALKSGPGPGPWPHAGACTVYLYSEVDVRVGIFAPFIGEAIRGSVLQTLTKVKFQYTDGLGMHGLASLPERPGVQHPPPPLFSIP